MKRPQRGEQSAFSLFPFLAVLLCTMGTMVVLLVAMAEVARQRAQAEADQKAAELQANQENAAEDAAELARLEQRLAQATKQLDELKRLKAVGAERLAEAQAHLSGVEDHIRRLRDEADALRVEAQELIVIEGEHDSDLKTARAELKRLQDLVAESEADLESLKSVATERRRSYAIVPLRDNASGTNRPPFYVECTDDGLLIQPDGVSLAWEDLVAPKFGNPLAAAERAVARYYSEKPEARAANEAGRPYPLLVVRPEGVSAYYRARDALSLAKVDFGYQPIGADWPLEYGLPDPVRRQWIEEAIADARSERRGLSRINPQLATAIATAEADAHATVAAFASGDGGSGVAGGQQLRVARRADDPNNPFRGLRIAGAPAENAENAGPFGGRQGAPRPGAELAVTNSPGGRLNGGGTSQGPGAEATSRGGQPGGTPLAQGQLVQGAPPNASNQGLPGAEAAAAGGSPNGSPGAAGQPSSAANANAGGAAGGSGQAPSAVGDPASAGAATQVVQGQGRQAEDYGDIQAPPSAPRRELPIVRPVSLYVAEDWVSIVGDRGVPVATTPFRGPSHQNINDLLAMLERHAEKWGIAGSGMYWDPRVVLRVAPDGSARAAELSQLLQAAGLKLRGTMTASNQGVSDAPPR